MSSKMKITAIILSAAMLCACGGTSDTPAVSSEDTVSETKSVSETASEGTEKPSETTEKQTEETKASETEQDAEKTDEEQLLYTFEDNSKVYDVKIDTDGLYAFRHSGNDDVPWNVYVLDEKFSDGYRYLYSNYAPSGVTEYETSLAAGQYVYLICTENEWTESEGDFADTSVSVYLKNQ